MKRLIAATLVAAMGVSLLTGCGVSNKSHDNTQVGTTENSSDNTKNKEVKMHVWCSKDDVDITTQMIESFKEANKGTDFNIIIEESEDSDARDNILSNVHNGADVFSIADDQIASMVAGGALYEIEDVDAVKKDNDESAVEAATIDGKLYGYPLTADNGYFMYYNKDYFSDSDVATLDGMLDIAGSNGKYVTMDWSSGWYIYSFFGNTGLDFGVNDDGVTNHCNWNAVITSIKGVDIAQLCSILQLSRALRTVYRMTLLQEYRTEVLLPVSADAGMRQKSRSYGVMIMVLLSFLHTHVPDSRFRCHHSRATNMWL